MSYNTSTRWPTRLRICAVHGEYIRLGPDPKPFGIWFYCPQYVRDMFENFNPQPRPRGVRWPKEVCLRRGVRYGQSEEGDHTVRLIEGGWPTPDAPYEVLARKGDILTLRPLAFPEAPTVEVPVSACWPDRRVRPSTRTCQD